MPKASCRAVGAYPVRVDFKALRAMMRCFGHKAYVRRLAGYIVLIEVEVTVCSKKLDLGSWNQESLQDVPYAEEFFSLDSREPLAAVKGQPGVRDFAMAFFLHFFDPAQKLITQFGAISIPPLSDNRPPHLSRLAYVFWD